MATVRYDPTAARQQLEYIDAYRRGGDDAREILSEYIDGAERAIAGLEAQLAALQNTEFALDIKLSRDRKQLLFVMHADGRLIHAAERDFEETQRFIATLLAMLSRMEG